jgi:hypothetical protein
MKKLLFLIFLVLFIPAILWGQDKIDAPAWTVGDRWVLGDDVVITVASADQNSYSLKYTIGPTDSVIVYEKPSLTRLYYGAKDKRINYEGRNKRLFNFPMEIGKSWQDKYVEKPTSLGAQETTYLETFTPLRWEEIAVAAGKFKAVKIEYKQEKLGQTGSQPKEGKVFYWYSPDVKYMLKCQYEKSDYWDEASDWELTAFKLKK